MRWLFPATLAVALVFLLHHLLLPLAWGAVLVIATRPLLDRLVSRGLPTGAAVAVLTLALVCVFGMPLAVVGTSLSHEVGQFSTYLQQLNKTGLPAPDWLNSLPVIHTQAVDWWNANLAQSGAVLKLLGEVKGDSVAHITGTLGGFGAALLANAFYILLSLLTFVIGHLAGSTIVEHLDVVGSRILPGVYPSMRRLVPLSIRGTALGLCSVAALEGVVLGIAYAIAGAPMPVMLGVLTGYLALVPGGAPLSFLCVSALLLAKGKTTGAVGLAIWGTFELFSVDKFIRPRIIGASVELPFLAVLFGLLGGVSTFGVIGLFVGPLLMALTFEYIRAEKADSAAARRQNEFLDKVLPKPGLKRRPKTAR
jgi:predicted PurR-regulated permease PerM